MADEKKTRWFEPVEFAAKARGLEDMLGQPVSAVAPARAVPLQQEGQSR
ncbi:hypothetical protein [Nonomuraea dietziae]|uniref:Uncharacterized protein n=1 Tax=Nonomuraea dietziae TaxID=65515 RepID=A0A7W5VAM7_9ACTN|nr:hypothetical protein [Nonomuraea dietziae]MBB3733737.1 hypothetical protein [Nonomuraea dietziae]